MNADDRTEFDTLVAELCAGFNVPMGERSAAYWKGLAKMPLSGFAKIVEMALGEDGPDKIPNVRNVWDIYRKRRLELRAPRQPEASEPEQPFDEWEARAGRRFMGYLWRTGRQAAERYGEGKYLGHQIGVTVHPQRAARMKFLLRGKAIWTEELRNCKPAERTQEYADTLFAELMEAAEGQAAKEILGDEALMVAA